MELVGFGGHHFLQPTLETICCSRFHGTMLTKSSTINSSTTIVEEKMNFMALTQEAMTLALILITLEVYIGVLLD